MITAPDPLAITVDTLYSLLHQWDSDSSEFSILESALAIVAHSLQATGRIPTGAGLREIPYSEVCCHMQVAGRLMWVEPVGSQHQMAQLYSLDGKKFSFPITAGEAGLHLSELKVYG